MFTIRTRRMLPQIKNSIPNGTAFEYTSKANANRARPLKRGSKKSINRLSLLLSVCWISQDVSVVIISCGEHEKRLSLLVGSR